MPEPKNTITDLTSGIYRRQYANFIKGKRINALTLEAEAWFWRVHAAADDFGNADGEPELVHAATAGRRRVTPQQVSGWLKEMLTHGLIREYESADEKFVHIVGFVTRQPAGRNGKRVRHFPKSPWDEDSPSRGNPGESRGILCSDSDSDSHSDSDSQKEDSAEPADAASAAASPVVLVFPTVAGKRNAAAEWELRENHVAELAATFPGVDVPFQCRKALAWVKANLAKRKTANGMPDFLFRWMSKEQDKGGGNGRPARGETPEEFAERVASKNGVHA